MILTEEEILEKVRNEQFDALVRNAINISLYKIDLQANEKDATTLEKLRRAEAQSSRTKIVLAIVDEMLSKPLRKGKK